ncbi:unnamed protein product, partial [Heligmosomoides polygyrus]|uniref:DUF5641 domain-containing protein n=1 Tax=Heligmosomoides polygyrus TaxID=6339 RepID=A0A183FTU6_HELPZ
MDINLPINEDEEPTSDGAYIPPEDAARLQTQLQTMKALLSSQALTDKYWKIWREHYLTALREHHKRYMDQKKGCAKTPREGEVVLLWDPCQKRHQWKMARITKIVISSDGAIREAEIICAKRKLRRPVNQLYPLEIEGTVLDDNKQCHEEDEQTGQSGASFPGRYHLRPRRTKGQTKEDTPSNTGAMHIVTQKAKPASRVWPSSIYLKMALMVLSIASSVAEPAATTPMEFPSEHVIECRKQGVYIDAPNAHGYELCVNDHCVTESSPPVKKVIWLPSEELLYDFEARWKLRYNDIFAFVEKSCPAQPFCSTIECTLCFTNILNPECWPPSAILGFGAVIYLLIALCYTICYVPLTVGRPFRLLFEGFCGLLYLIVYILGKCACCMVFRLRKRKRQSTRILDALAIFSLFSAGTACQIVNIFSHPLRTCTTSEGATVCKLEMASVLKINTFKRDACFRLQHNESTVMEVRMHWIHLRLLCDKSTLMYTRNVTQNVIDSKRCAHMGSCRGNKCADVHSTSLLPELALGNNYPGRTGCLESCGGPGCDCFYLSSGCLFYRIYAVPTDEKIFEIFTCTRWKEEVKLQVQIRRPSTKSFKTFIVALRPNVPVQILNTSITLSVLAIPPILDLETDFISTKNTVALWAKDKKPIMQCPTQEEAKKLQCHIKDACTCSAAESKVNCRCEDEDITKKFRNIEDVLPVTRPSLRIAADPRTDVTATVDQGVSAELILNVQETVDSSLVDFTDEQCLIDNVHIIGCYSCNKGALAEIRCRSTKGTVSAEIDCGIESFTTLCSPTTEISKLRFMLNHAQVWMRCSVRCGSNSTFFEVTGILKIMAQRPPAEELRRKRRAEEQKLIDTLKYRRSCVKLAPTLPTEDEVQTKIRTFMKRIINLIKSNDTQKTFTEVQGSRPRLYARGEATLYKAKVENVFLKTSHLKDCLCSAVEGLAMTHETYKYLILAEAAKKDSMQKFYQEDVEGVTIEPVFASDYARREIEFLDELLKNMESEITSANVQIGIEVHTSPLKELSETVASLQKTLQEGIASLKEQMEKAEVKVAEVVERVDSLTCSVENLKEHINKGSFTENPSGQRGVQEEAKTSEETSASNAATVADTDVNDGSVVNRSEGEIEEDLLDLDYEGENGVESAVAHEKDTR